MSAAASAIAAILRDAAGRLHSYLGERIWPAEREILISIDAALIAITGDAMMLRRHVLNTVREFVESCEESSMPEVEVEPVRTAYGDLCTLWGFDLVDGYPAPMAS